MKFIVMTLIVCALALMVYASPFEKPAKKPCIKDCGSDYKPVCGKATDAKNPTTFGNECVLDNYKCESGKVVELVVSDACPDKNAPVRL